MRLLPSLCLYAAPIALAMASQPAVASGHYVTKRSVYAACVKCHQPNGWGSADGTIPNIAGQRATYIEKQVKMFRSGVRQNEAMRPIVEHPQFADPQRLKALAESIARLPWNPQPKLGPGDNLAGGQETYEHICAACHGADGGGQAANAVPRIAGQHYPYLLRQIATAAALHRDLAPPEMTSGLRALTERERAALADYIARLARARVPTASPISPTAPPPHEDD
jgi:cytochrome c553